MASRLLSTFESAGLAATATFASVLWIGLALPGLPLLPGVGGGQNSNVAISLSSAVLGVQDSHDGGGGEVDHERDEHPVLRNREDRLVARVGRLELPRLPVDHASPRGSIER